jgi:two-component system OmpR family response regulator
VTKRILVVDDDHDVRTLIAMSLSRVGGHDVRAAASGSECMAELEQWVPDVVVLDVMMPGNGTGPATLAAIRATPAVAEVPVVFLTASVVEADMERLHSLPVSGVLGKPFDPMQLPTLPVGAARLVTQARAPRMRKATP